MKAMRKMLSVLIALVMIMTSGIAVFAEGTDTEYSKTENAPKANATAPTSPSEGDKEPPKVWNLGASDSYKSKWFNHKYGGSNVDYYISQMRVKGGAWRSASTKANSPSKMWSGLQDGQIYDFQAIGVKNGKQVTSSMSHRWMMSVKATAKSTKAGQFTVNWQKVKGATTYQIEYSKNSNMSSPKYVYASSSSISSVIKASKGTWYYRVRPIKKSGYQYSGIYNAVQSVLVK